MTNTPHISFLESEFSPRPPDQALFHIIPAPLEASVSYGTGTAGAPAAILEASQELENFDGISCPGEAGIYTAPMINVTSTKIALAEIERAMTHTFALKKIPILLGGEHTVSVGAFRSLRHAFEEIGIIQFDAHADLRESYQGSTLSHACVMHHALALGLPCVQIGVRSLSYTEHLLRTERKLCVYDADAVHSGGIEGIHLPADFPERVYITFDVDVFDPSVMPATGTPEPGGLTWQQVMGIFRMLAQTRTIVGLDCTELAPVSGFHAPQFTCARLIYNLMGMMTRKG